MKIRKELNMHNIIDVIVDCRDYWTQHLLRINGTIIPKLVYEYIPAGRRN
jgi:hypothetical protein